MPNDLLVISFSNTIRPLYYWSKIVSPLHFLWFCFSNSFPKEAGKLRWWIILSRNKYDKFLNCSSLISCVLVVYLLLLYFKQSFHVNIIYSFSYFVTVASKYNRRSRNNDDLLFRNTILRLFLNECFLYLFETVAILFTAECKTMQSNFSTNRVGTWTR